MQRDIPVPVPRPRTAPHSHPVASVAALAMRVHRPLALVVHDCRFLAEQVARVLAARGFDTVVAPDGYAALHRVRDRRFDLVVLDVDTPFVGGMTLLRQIRLDPVHADVPVLVLGSDPRGEHEHALAQGASAYLAKPLQARSITTIVDSLLG